MAKMSAAFKKVFGASMEATDGKSADYFKEKRVRTGKTKRDRKGKSE